MTMTQDNGWVANYEKWVQTAPLKVLQCRRDGHTFPKWEEVANPRARMHARKIKGIVEVEVPCRNRCGVTRTQFVDPGTGYLARSNKIVLDYTGNPAYKIPKNARSGKGFSRLQRAVIRAETITRLSDWITAED